jgi:hypothetical protein
MREAVSKLEQTLRQTLGESAANAEVDLLVKFAEPSLKQDSTVEREPFSLGVATAA